MKDTKFINGMSTVRRFQLGKYTIYSIYMYMYIVTSTP